MTEYREGTRVARASKGIQRRLFLRAAALGLAAPAAFNLSRLAVAAPAGAPKRMLIFHMPHGVPNIHYNPKVMGSDLTQFALDKSFESILGPLEPYKQYVNVYQGFKYANGGGPHVNAVNFLTDSKDLEGNLPRISIDQAIGKKLGIKPLNLGASSRPLGAVTLYPKVFWDGTGFVEAEKNPVKAADAVFAGLKAPTGVNPDVEAREALLKLTEGEVQGLQQELAALTTEQTKLKAHLDALLALHSGGGGGGGALSCTAAPALPNVEKIRALKMPDVTPEGTPNWYLGDYQGDNQNFPLILAAQMEVAAQAIACNAAPIVTLQAMFSTSAMNFKFMGINKAHHNDISHNGPEMNPEMISNPLVTDFAIAQRWFTEQIVEGLLKPLLVDDPAAPGSKIIDNTIIYFCSEIGDGQNHTLKTEDYPTYHPAPQPYTSAYLPLVTIGGGGGALKTGRIVRNAVDRPAADLYLTLAQAMGAPLMSFGDSTGVIQEVLA
ncbi:MAG TPA: DUF1552 domain-containing protein [Polyangiaceae bacterium]|nr:DUF1552 domain-containing protein [Polyangiaceae bacterium]